MEGKNESDLWTVELGDKFTRDRGTPDEWEVVEVEEKKGMGGAYREVTLSATEYNEMAEESDSWGASDITVKSYDSQFEEEFEAVE